MSRKKKRHLVETNFQVIDLSLAAFQQLFSQPFQRKETAVKKRAVSPPGDGFLIRRLVDQEVGTRKRRKDHANFLDQPRDVL